MNNSPRNNSDCAHNVVRKFGFATRAGSYPQHSNKKNQDVFILEPNISKKKACHLFGIADGHGKNGQFAA